MCKWGLEVGESADADTDVSAAAAAAATAADSCGTGVIPGSCDDSEHGDGDRNLFVGFEPTNIGSVTSGLLQLSKSAKRSR